MTMTLFPWENPLLHIFVIMTALSWDRWLGEPPVKIHPVVWMGNCIGLLKKNAPKTPMLAFLWGIFMVVVVPTLSAILSIIVFIPWIGILLAIWLMTSTFALRGLIDAGLDVADALDEDNLPLARKGLRSLCSRDPNQLDEILVSAAATESVAENCSDSLVAPLFWYAIAGIPGALFYRCVNTLDAMVGYRGKYEWLGKPSARLDDFLNLLPARVCTLFILGVGYCTSGASLRNGIHTLHRDRHVTSSPNAGWPMSAIAGLLDVELEKPNHYVIGKGLSHCNAQKLRLSCIISERAMHVTSFLLLIYISALGLLQSF